MPDREIVVSVVIVTYNSLPRFRDCLQALKLSDAAYGCELIIVDNGSTDGTCEVVGEMTDRAVLMRNDRNIGFAAACNQGATQARGTFLLFLNPDVSLDRSAISELSRVCREREKAGLVSARLRNADGSFQATCRNLPTVGNILLSRGSVLGRFFPRSTVYTLGDFRVITPVPAVAATAALIRRDLSESIGGFDTRFFMYMEDTDLSQRLSQSGYVNYFVPTAGGTHYWGEGSNAGRISRAVRHHSSVWKYFLKHMPHGFSILLLPIMLATNLLLVVVIGAFRRRRSP